MRRIGTKDIALLSLSLLDPTIPAVGVDRREEGKGIYPLFIGTQK